MQEFNRPRSYAAARLIRQREYHHEYNANHYQKNREAILAKKAQYRLEHGGELRARQRFCQRKLNTGKKLEVLTHYGNGKCACIKCGESRLACLSIDHIDGGGTQHIKQVGIGSRFYYWLKNNNYPNGYQTLCMNCQWVKRAENNEGISE